MHTLQDLQLPPKDLYIVVRVLKDCGKVMTSSGEVNLEANTTHYVQRKDVEMLIKQGMLEHIEWLQRIFKYVLRNRVFTSAWCPWTLVEPVRVFVLCLQTTAKANKSVLNGTTGFGLFCFCVCFSSLFKKSGFCNVWCLWEWLRETVRTDSEHEVRRNLCLKSLEVVTETESNKLKMKWESYQEKKGRGNSQWYKLLENDKFQKLYIKK